VGWWQICKEDVGWWRWGMKIRGEKKKGGK
jgi:hypothetical protein